MKEKQSVITPPHLQAERLAIASSCCGFTGEAVLTESAVIMVFAGMLGAGEALKLLTTAVFPFLSGILMLPLAYIALKFTCRKLTVWATLLAAVAYLCTVFTPWGGSCKVSLLLTLLVVFAISLSGFVAGWFPLLDTFLLPERRTGFIGRMRFMHQLSAVTFLLLTGWWLGKEPTLPRLQLVIAIAGVIFIGRTLFIWLLPKFNEERSKDLSWQQGIVTAWRNQKLRRGAFFVGGLNLAIYGTTPLWIIYLQKNGQGDNVLVYISAAALSGMMLGYLIVGRLHISDHARALQILLRSLLVLSLILLVLPLKGAVAAAAVGMVLLLYNFCIALISVCATALMLNAAAPGNKTMAMAFFGAVGNSGMGTSRVAAALLINFAPVNWLAGYLHTNIFLLLLGISTLLLLIMSLTGAYGKDLKHLYGILP